MVSKLFMLDELVGSKKVVKRVHHVFNLVHQAFTTPAFFATMCRVTSCHAEQRIKL